MPDSVTSNQIVYAGPAKGGLDIERLPTLYNNYRYRYMERDERMDEMASVLRGSWEVFDPDEDKIDFRSPNLIQVAIEDTSEAAAILPTIRAQAVTQGKRDKKTAAATERICTHYLDAANIDLLLPQTIADIISFGLGVWVVYPDMENRVPRIEKRNPRTFYPEPGHRPGDDVTKGLFSREIYWTQLPQDWQWKMENFVQLSSENVTLVDNMKITLVEYFDEEEMVIAALFNTDPSWQTPKPGEIGYIPVELERMRNPNPGICPIVLGSRFSFDGEFRGQFDQTISMLEAHGRLMSMVLDYADQSVYSDLWVRDPIGEVPMGGGSFIELGPNGAIGRVPPAVTSLNINQDLQMLQEGIHVGGRWPKTRPGDIDQSIASAKFVEATAGMMNTNLKTLHQLMKHMMERTLNIALRIDKAMLPGEPRTAQGLLRNQEFIEEYTTDDIDVDVKVRVEYGLGLGRDPAQSAVLHIQYAQAGFVSKEFVQENIDGLTDVAREISRIDVEQLRGVALAKILQGVEQGSVSDRQLLDMAQARIQGDDLWKIFEETIVAPQEEAAAAGPMLPPGMPPQMAALLGAGGPQGPGGPPGGLGGPPGAPPAGPGGGGPQPPPAPGPNQILSRLSSNVDGGLLGSEVRSNG